MKAIVNTKSGLPEVLKVMEVNMPIPGDDKVLIQVKASAINVTEYQLFTKQVNEGKPSLLMKIMDKLVVKSTGKVPGGEAAGIVEEVGKNVTRFKKGDEVFGITADILGAWAEYACADETMIYEKPANVSFEEAAVIPTTGATALSAVRKANIKKGQNVLIHGASGGVGIFAVQLAKAAGATVTGVCSTRNVELVRNIGADYVIDYKKEDFKRGGEKYDAIIAINGYNSVSTYKKLLSDHGCYIVIGGVRQAVEALLLGTFLFWGSKKSMRTATYIDIKGKGLHYLDYLKELVETGHVRPIIDKVYPVRQVPEAIRYIITEHAQGKLAITMDFSK